jgi:prepilin-type N-terminal cleavage/methylation domain-containing protein
MESPGRLSKAQRSVTLLELVIVLAIIAILASQALLYFFGITTRAKQSEAKLVLKQIYEMERAYYIEYDAYWRTDKKTCAAQPDNFARIGVIISPQALYEYQIKGQKKEFTATATSAKLDQDEKEDVWTIDEKGVLCCISDDAQD